ncbi:MAG TPA: MBL fold metallo-hydrolase, partial [Chthoniobacterales bacterium]|nr:MBL fold metallo-hydrolase [Chthoniobacterales bacterium]
MSAAPGSSTRVKLWGVRGSIPVPGPGTVRYGGNTACVEIRADGELIVLDAGSGIRELGLALEKEFGARPINLSLLISHVHWDHIQGFPFFVPSYNQKNELRVFGYNGANTSLQEILKGQMATPFFPIGLYDLPGKIHFENPASMNFKIGRVEVRARQVNHPGVCLGYRIVTSKGSIAYLPDHEPYDACKLHSEKSHSLTSEQMRKQAEDDRLGLIDFLQDCEILILDSQYTDLEYQTHVGWGHGSLSASISLAAAARIRTLILFHHDPAHDDDAVDKMVNAARDLAMQAGNRVQV